ncbi:MAG: 2-oxoglutarate dehydrogenase complex dihydrolipoyllysine-residue succinyltransferase [Pseudomonadota bacterium]|nr:2-oxoglutarate dehydrogenase complex dihydrolipoyllysine-residue succinyltransferase [Pseudomonadota bacterium]
MSIEVKVPALPESVTEATVAVWNKKPGDRVSRDENICELETDKVMLEVPAVADGVLKEIKAEEGATVGSGDVIAVLEEGAGGGDSDAGDASDADQKADSADEQADADDGNTPPLSPAVRKLVAEHDLDPSKIEGTGKGGRIVKSDVEDYLAKQSNGQSASKRDAAAGKSEAKPAPTSDPVSVPSGDRVEQRVPMTRIRKRIAERLVEAQQTAAMLTTFNEVDLQAVMDLRARYKDNFAKSYDIKLGFMSFFVKAAVEALKRYPVVNASIDDDDVVYHGYYDIGIAVSTERGLVVPILRDAESMSFAEIEQAIANYGKKAREGKITMDDLQGGTFSITNGGIFGSMLSTPILNPPQSAILGMHGIIERPIAINGEVVIRPMMYLALSYDHRLIDGKDAVMFLRTIKETLEDPGRLLLQI